jgi:two-component system NtrC family response regulator
MISDARFREDLFYRLAEIVVTIPSLAEREGDGVLLAHSFLTRFNKEMRRNIKGFTPDALAALTAWHWPGNVRELENRMKRAVIMAENNRITAQDLDLEDKVSNAESLNLKIAREEADRRAIRLALARVDGNISMASKLLGISRPTFYDLIKQYNINI